MRETAVLYQGLILSTLQMLSKHQAERARYHPLADVLAQIVQWIRRYDASSEKESVAMFEDWYEHVVIPSDLYTSYRENMQAILEQSQYDELQRTGQIADILEAQPDAWIWFAYVEDSHA